VDLQKLQSCKFGCQVKLTVEGFEMIGLDKKEVAERILTYLGVNQSDWQEVKVKVFEDEKVIRFVFSSSRRLPNLSYVIEGTDYPDRSIVLMKYTDIYHKEGRLEGPIVSKQMAKRDAGK